jgi:hypothetical protein
MTKVGWNPDLRFVWASEALDKHYSEKNVRRIEFKAEIDLGSVKLKAKLEAALYVTVWSQTLCH